MKIDIDKLRAAYAATTQGEWRVKEQRDYQACNSKVECNAGYVVATGYSSPSVKIEYKKLWAEAEGNTNFIALAHNEFPTLLDEIERLRNAEKTEHDRRLAVETVLVNLLCVINDDKDGGFFICAEAKDRIEDAQDVMGVAK